MQKDLEENEDRLLGILQPQLTELRESTKSHASQEQQNQKIAT
jgi:hypothetical protein